MIISSSQSISNFYKNISISILEKSSKQKKPVVHIDSVRKSGTHLLEKIFFLFGIKPGYKRGNIHLSEKLIEKNNGKSWAELYRHKKKFCILYRDPRDLVISQILFRLSICKNHVFANGKKARDYSVSRLLDISLNAEKIPPDSNRVGYYANLLFKGLRVALFLKKHPAKNRLLVRFEDLIPSFSGGASSERRFEVFNEICDFAGISATDAKVRQVMDDCWGGTWTFRSSEKKKVGQWEKYFEPRHILLFREKYNHLLLGLGYETDPNWHLKYLNKNESCV